MSTSVEQHPIDHWPLDDLMSPVECRLDGVDKRLESLELYLVWGFRITWMLVIATGVLTRVVHG